MTPQTTAKILASPQMVDSLQSAGKDIRERPYKPICYPLAFKVDGLAPCVRAAHQAVQWWLNDIMHSQHDRRRWVTLYGKTGTGKTHLAKMARAVIMNSGRRVMFRRWGAALDAMLSGEWELMGEMARVPVLILDDVGMEYMGSDKSREINAAKLGELLDARLGMWTLITSNLTPEQLAHALGGDTRVSSRLYRGGSELVDMTTAKDYEKTRYGQSATPAERERRRGKPMSSPWPKRKVKLDENRVSEEEAKAFWAELRKELES